MRLMQVGGRGGRRVVATDRGRSWFVRRYKTTYDLASAAIRARSQQPSQPPRRSSS